MASSKTISKGLRLSNECAAYFEGKPLNRMVECLHGLLECGRLRWDGEELIVNERAKIPDELNEKLENAGKVFHMTVDELIAEFVRMLYAGEIECEDKVLYPRMPKWVQDLDTRVRKDGIDGDKLAEKVMKMIEDGEI